MSHLKLALQISWASLRFRRGVFFSGVLVVSLCVALLLVIEQLRKGAEQGFSGAISDVDLVVGARSSPLQLVLYSVFNLGGATVNISWEAVQKIAAHPAVDWVIPLALGDGYRGFRVVGTDSRFYQHYRVHRGQRLSFASGKAPEQIFEVVLGFEVARSLGYQIGSQVAIVHGDTRGQGFLVHDDKPFTVSGILSRTGTVVDHSLYIDLKGFEAIHKGWEDGTSPSQRTSWSDLITDSHADELVPESITAVLLRTTSRIDSLRLQRELNQNLDEPLTAAMPGVVLSELWQWVGYGQRVLQVVSGLVVGVSLISVTVFLLLLFEFRRQEISVLRAIGASKPFVVLLFALDGLYILFLGLIGGLLLALFGFFISQWILAHYFGLVVVWVFPGVSFWFGLTAVIGLGLLASLVPAKRAYWLSVKDGLYG